MRGLAQPIALGIAALSPLTALALLTAQPPNQPPPSSAPAEGMAAAQALSQEIVGGLVGSKHDFSRGEPHPRDLCLPCHAPHLPGANPPLLDRRPAATQPIRTYSALAIELDGASLLCMSCHDGLFATDVFTSSHSTRLASQLGASSLGYGGLQGHPVGVTYPSGDTKYHPASVVAADGSIKLPDGRIQCTSCHDPHNARRHEGLLVKSNERSRLCLSCHRL
jgi:predicted CXXCH cytochrome family protein